MESNLSFKSDFLSHKLKDYFRGNIKVSLINENKIFIITKNDTFYEINIFDKMIASFILSNDNSILDKMIVKELCHTNIIDLSYGLDYYSGRAIDKKIYCWGYNNWRQLGNGRRDEKLVKPQLNALLSELNIIDIKCRAFYSIGLTESGVYEWVSNELKPIKVNGLEDEKVVMISCGYWHSMALTESGRVFSWGGNRSGQLGIGNTIDSNKSKLIKLNDVIIQKINCGRNHSLLLSSDGDIYAFGDNSWGQIGNGNKEIQLKPLKLLYKNTPCNTIR
jgi:alpha-tubulin suppressor-like RCC1 family protein